MIQKAVNDQQLRSGQTGGKLTVNQLMNNILDAEGMRKRFDDLLGKRAPQFVSAIVSLVNSTPQLQEAFYESPMTVIQSALKAATFDLPIDPGLGFAYLVPFRNKQADGSRKMECTSSSYQSFGSGSSAYPSERRAASVL